jgi:hypothetical protein
MKLKKMTWVEYVVCMWRIEMYIGYLWESRKEKRPPGRPGHKWRDHLKWVLEKQDECLWTGLIWLRMGATGRMP